jgi:hypothetical protein
VTADDIARYLERMKQQDAEIKAMEMLLGAIWTPPAFGMPGYFHRIVKRQEGIMIHSHEEFYDKDGKQIENPWKWTQPLDTVERVPATYSYDPAGGTGDSGS